MQPAMSKTFWLVVQWTGPWPTERAAAESKAAVECRQHANVGLDVLTSLGIEPACATSGIGSDLTLVGSCGHKSWRARARCQRLLWQVWDIFLTSSHTVTCLASLTAAANQTRIRNGRLVPIAGRTLRVGASVLNRSFEERWTAAHIRTLNFAPNKI
jgi:hypothetical protein